jgi:hypothetical protein
VYKHAIEPVIEQSADDHVRCSICTDRVPAAEGKKSKKPHHKSGAKRKKKVVIVEGEDEVLHESYRTMCLHSMFFSFCWQHAAKSAVSAVAITFRSRTKQLQYCTA